MANKIDMKFYKKLIITFFLITFISCILGSLLKSPIDTLVERYSSFAELADYEDGMYNYGKIMRRIFMIAAIIVFLFSRKSLGLIHLAANGFKRRQSWKKEIAAGLIVGICSLLIYGAFTLFVGVQHIETDLPSNSRLIIKPFIYLFEACLIGLFEETLFRGFILQGLMKDLSVSISVISGSLFYAALHFFSFKVAVSPGFEPFVGFSTLIKFFIPAVFDLHLILPYIIGLFIVGVVLSLAYVHTRSLYLPIGLHAGLVLGVKLNRFFLDHNHNMSNWFFGDGRIVTGIFGWIFLAGVLVIIKMMINQYRFDADLKV